MRQASIAYAHSDVSGNSTGQLFSSHDSIDGPIGKRSSVISNSSQSSTGYSSQTKVLSDISERAQLPQGISERAQLPQGAPLAQLEDLSPIQPMTSQTNPKYVLPVTIII